MRRLHDQLQILWICVDDFDAIHSNDEKVGDSDKSNLTMVHFLWALDDCKLSNLGIEYKGPLLTWNNGRPDSDNVKEQLDLVVANVEWRTIFLNIRVMHLNFWGLDHRVICVELDSVIEKSQHKKGSRPFRF